MHLPIDIKSICCCLRIRTFGFFVSEHTVEVPRKKWVLVKIIELKGKLHRPKQHKLILVAGASGSTSCTLIQLVR